MAFWRERKGLSGQKKRTSSGCAWTRSTERSQSTASQCRHSTLGLEDSGHIYHSSPQECTSSGCAWTRSTGRSRSTASQGQSTSVVAVASALRGGSALLSQMCALPARTVHLADGKVDLGYIFHGPSVGVFVATVTIRAARVALCRAVTALAIRAAARATISISITAPTSTIAAAALTAGAA